MCPYYGSKSRYQKVLRSCRLRYHVALGLTNFWDCWVLLLSSTTSQHCTPAEHGGAHADTRADEMACVPWPAGLKQSFLDQQFDLQHRHYINHYADADFLVLERAGEVVGRLYLQRRSPEHLVVDISLLGPLRGQGLGGALLAQAQADAAAAGCVLVLHVRRDNPAARRLYIRLGFLASGGSETHERLAWRPSAS